MRSLACIMLLALTLAAGAQEPGAAKPTLDEFAWLAGQWRIEHGDRQVDEHWMSPAGGLMIGMARMSPRWIAARCDRRSRCRRHAAPRRVSIPACCSRAAVSTSIPRRDCP